MGETNLVLYAIWAPNTNTAYTVQHWLQDLDNAQYTMDPIADNLTGTTDTTIYDDNHNRTLAGFTYVSGAQDGITQANVNADGSTVLNLYYTQDTQDINGAKTWQQIEGELKPIVTFELYRKLTTDAAYPAAPYKTTTLAVNDTYKFEGLPTHNLSSVAYDYRVLEVAIPGYSSVQDGYDFTNTADQTSITGTKTWISGTW